MKQFSFPLTPALSLGERENRIQIRDETNDGICRALIEKCRASGGCSLSPGERVRVRGELASE